MNNDSPEEIDVKQTSILKSLVCVEKYDLNSLEENKTISANVCKTEEENEGMDVNEPSRAKYDLVDVKEEKIDVSLDDDENLSANVSKTDEENERIVNEPNRAEYDLVDVKEENIDLTLDDHDDIKIEPTEIQADNDLPNTCTNSKKFNCKICHNKYQGYCPNCSTLSHFLNRSVPPTNPYWNKDTVPIDTLQIRDDGVFALKTLPKNVIFGPFEGIFGIESSDGYMWEINDTVLKNIENGNWMKYVNCVAIQGFENLRIFQFDGNLYFQTSQTIMEGQQLLTYYDNEEIYKSDCGDESYYIPVKEEKSQEVLACTLCCLGFSLATCLIEHKTKCSRAVHNINNLSDIIQCSCCKIWLENCEHTKSHEAYCNKSYPRIYRYPAVARRVKINISNHMNETTSNLMFSNELNTVNINATPIVSIDVPVPNEIVDGYVYKCALCSYKSIGKKHYSRHFKTHFFGKEYYCHICSNVFTSKRTLSRHQRRFHGNTKLI